jgi:hypothetical protein
MSNPYNEGVATRFSEDFKELAGKFVESQSFKCKTGRRFYIPTHKDHRKKTLIYFSCPNFYEEIVSQATQARDMGTKKILDQILG